MLELKDICFERSGKKILDHINLKLDEQKFYVITGPFAKLGSIYMEHIMGIEKPDTGTILLNGQDITNKSIDERAKLGIGFAFQQPVQFKGITVYDLLKLSTKQELTKKEACEILSKVGLCAIEYVDREVNKSLSGGELKRIEIATVMARNPYLAIFDEPEAGIDLWSFQNLTEVFKEISKESSGTTLVISHQERILNIADEIILMGEGTIQEFGRKEEVFDQIFKPKKCCKEVKTCGSRR